MTVHNRQCGYVIKTKATVKNDDLINKLRELMDLFSLKKIPLVVKIKIKRVD